MAEGQPRPIDIVANQVRGRYAELVVSGSENPLVEQTFEMFQGSPELPKPLAADRIEKINAIKSETMKAASARIAAKSQMQAAEKAGTEDPLAFLNDKLQEQIKKATKEGRDPNEAVDSLIAGFEVIAEAEEKKLRMSYPETERVASNSENNLSTFEGLEKHIAAVLAGIETTIITSNTAKDGKLPHGLGNQLTEDARRLVETIERSDFLSDIQRNELKNRVDAGAFRKVLPMMFASEMRDTDYESTFESLAVGVEADCGLNIRRADEFLQWTRDLMQEVLDKHPSDVVDFDKMMTIPVGVFQISFESLLKLIPKDLKGIDQLRVGINNQEKVTIKEFRTNLGKELGFVSSNSIRRLMIMRVYGDLMKMGEAYGSLAEGSSMITLTANDYEDVGHFLPMFSISRNGSTGKYVSQGIEHVRLGEQKNWSEAFKEALSRYYIMKQVWQDQLSLRYKVVDENGEKKVYVLGKGYDQSKLKASEIYTTSGFLESLQNPTFGLNDDDVFRGDESRVIQFLADNGYLPDGVGISNVLVTTVDNFNAIAGDFKKWDVPGLSGRRELRRMNGKYIAGGKWVGGDVEFKNHWGTIVLARNGKMVDENIFFANPRISAARVDAQRERIKMWAGGVNPDSIPRDMNGNLKSTSERYRSALNYGRIAEYAAYCMMYGGAEVAALDMDQGDNAPNKMVRMARWASVQTRTGRPAPDGELIQAIARMAVPFSEAYRLGRTGADEIDISGDIDVVQTSKVKTSLFGTTTVKPATTVMPRFMDWILRTDKKWTDIPFREAEGLDLPDKAYATTFSFATQMFAYATEHAINFAKIANPLPNGAVEIDPKVGDEVSKLWKACYLTTMPMQLSNGQYKFYRNNDGKYPMFGPMDLAKQLFREIIESNLRKHAPQPGIQRATGLFAQRESTVMKVDDERGFYEIMRLRLKRGVYDWRTGKLLGREEQLFSNWEISDMLNRSGLGDSAWLRRTAFNSD